MHIRDGFVPKFNGEGLGPREGEREELPSEINKHSWVVTVACVFIFAL